MTPYLRCLATLILAASVGNIGCSSHKYSDEDIKKRFGTGLFMTYSPNANEMDKAAQQQFQIGDSKVANRLFQFYCQDNKQKRRLAVPIKAILSQSPNGLPLDAASDGVALKKELIRDMAETFFIRTATAKIPGRNDTGNLFATPFGTYDSAVTKARAWRIGVEKSKSLDIRICPPYLDRWLIGDGMSSKGCVREDKPVLAFYDRTHPLLATFIPLPRIIGPQIAFTDVTDLRGGGFIKAQPDPISVEDRTGWLTQLLSEGKGRPEPNQMVQLFPAPPVVSYEAHWFTSQFTMLIPETIQKQVFAKYYDAPYGIHAGEYDSNRNGYIDGKGFFVNSDESFNLTDAVEKRTALWNAYFKTFTQIKEAQTEDPVVIDFEVNLDLNLFCAYGRNINDLTSK